LKKYQRIILVGCLVLLLTGLLLMTGLIDTPFSHLISQIFKKPLQTRWITNLHRIGLAFSLAGLILAGFIRFVAPGLPEFARRIFQIEQRLSNRLQNWLQGYLAPASSSPTKRADSTRTINGIDGIVAAGFLIFSLLFFLGRLQGNYPTVILGGDGGNIASFATAWDHPELFKGDELLNNLDNIRIYNTLHIPLIRALHLLTGDYGLAYLLLLAPHIFLHLLGFYILGRVLFKNRFWALLLAVVISMPFSINLGELWGISRDPLPRFTYQAILPYVLSLTIDWKDRPRRWPWLMVFSGLLFYAHPVSAPTFGFAIWLGLWLVHPKDWSWKKRVLVMLGLGIIFVLSAAPFAVNYFTHHEQGSSGNYEAILSIIQNFFPKNLLNVWEALQDFWKIITNSGLFPLAILGVAILWVIKRHDRKILLVILTWAAGLGLIAVVIPAIERTIEHYFKLLPLETELMRGLRYFIPIMLLFCLWPLSELSQRLKNRAAARSIAVLGLLLTGYWVLTYPPDFDKIGPALTCLGQGKLVCVTDETVTQEIEVIKANVPQGAPIFAYTTGGPSFSYSLEIRYAAERPLVYSFKDRGLLGYANHTALLDWQANNHNLQVIEENYSQTDRVESLIWFARGLHAQYLLVDFPVSQSTLENLSVSSIYRDSQSTLMFLKPN